MNQSGIYKIQSIKNPNRFYIGSAVNIRSRWSEHLCHLKKNRHHSNKLQRHYNKYGKDDLVFSIILGCDKEELIKHEQFFLDSLNPWFNTCKNAGSPLGYKHTEIAKKKMSKSQIGHIPWNKGKKDEYTFKRTPFTQEHKLKLSISHKGQVSWNKGKHGIYSQETLKKMSEASKKRTGRHYQPSQETIEKIRKTLTGRKKGPPSPETIEKIRQSNKGKKHGPMPLNVKEKIRQSCKNNLPKTIFKKGSKPWNYIDGRSIKLKETREVA